MRLRSITLDNVRRFTDPVTVGPIGDGVTLLCEPNEAGKSTLFDALHALFFLRHSGQTAEIRALRPHSGGKIAVECTLEHEGAVWRVRKEWLSGASAKVWRDGVLAHQGDAAEDWLTALVTGDAGGPGGLLWVRQGQVSLKVPDKKKAAEQEFAERRDLLTAISGAMDQVTGGERMDRVRAQVDADLARLQTATGRPKTGGRWADAEAAVTHLSEREVDLRRTVDTLRDDLETRRRLQNDLEPLQDPQALAQRRADLDAAAQALREAQGRAQELAAAQMSAKLARQQATAAGAQAERAAHLRATRAAAQTAHESSTAALQEARSKADRATSDHSVSQVALNEAKQTVAQAAATLRGLDQQERSVRAQQERQRLDQLITDAQGAEADRIAAQAVAAQGPDAASLKRIDGLARDVDTHRRMRSASAPRLSVAYDAGAPMVQVDGIAFEAGQIRPLPDGAAVFMPGIGTLSIDVADGSSAQAAHTADAALQDALQQGGWPDIAALQEAARIRDAAQRRADLAAQRRDTLAPDGLSALRDRRAVLGQAEAATDLDLPDRDSTEALHIAAMNALAVAEGEEARLSSIAQAARVMVAKTEAADLAAQQALQRAEQDCWNLSNETPEQTASNRAALDAEAAAKEAALAHLQQAAPDVGKLTAHHTRLKAILDNATADASRIRAEIGRLDGRIEALGDEGVEEALAEVKGALETAQDTLARVVFEKDVLTRLAEALDTAQRAARETYFAPVAEELRPLLTDLWGEADLIWSDDTLLPSKLVRRGTEEPIDVLSGGTQEQIALLVRLAFARLLAKTGRHAPLILDDALVYSDDDRIEKMFDALHGAAGDLQILVLSCRQRAFRDLGAPSLGFQAVPRA